MTERFTTSDVVALVPLKSSDMCRKYIGGQPLGKEVFAFVPSFSLPAFPV
jgi:hypothetical protein